MVESLPSYLAWVTPWITQHAAFGYPIVFLAALFDSLIFVGLLVPGIAILFAVGTLVGFGVLDLKMTLLFAYLGACSGDIISFELGKRYSTHLFDFNVFRKYKTWLHKAHIFLKNHGAKGIIIGRFIGPIRATLPTVAGMLNMPRQYFLTADLISGVPWALVYVLPGALLGHSLKAIEVSTPVLWILGALVFLGALGAWSAYYAWGWSQRLFTKLLDRLSRLSNLGFCKIFSRAPAPALLFFISLIIFSVTLLNVMTDGVLIHINQTLAAFFQDHKTPPLIHIAVVLTQLGDDAILLPVTALVTLVLILQKNYRVLFCLLGSIGVAVTLTAAFKVGLKIPRPSLESLTTAYAFPSGHATHSTLLWGYLFYLFAETLSSHFVKKILYAFLVLLILSIGFSRVVLGVHWLADIIAGISLGTLVLCSFILIQNAVAFNSPLRLTTISQKLSSLFLLGIILIYQTTTHEKNVAWYQTVKINPYRLFKPAISTRYGLTGPSLNHFDLHFKGSLKTVLRTLHRQGWNTLNPEPLLHLLKSQKPWQDALNFIPPLHLAKFPSAILVQGKNHLYLWSRDHEDWVGLILDHRKG